MNEHRSIVFQDEESRRLGQEGVQTAGVRDFAAGDDQTHRGNLLSVSESRRRTHERPSGSGGAASRGCRAETCRHPTVAARTDVVTVGERTPRFAQREEEASGTVRFGYGWHLDLSVDDRNLTGSRRPDVGRNPSVERLVATCAREYEHEGVVLEQLARPDMSRGRSPGHVGSGGG